MKIDLQIHTNHSDGRDTIEDIVQDAQSGGLDVIAVTDHDLVSAVAIMTTEANTAGIKVVPGVEITTGYRGQPIHILGFCIDVENMELLSFLKSINDYRKEYFISLLPEINKNLVKDGKNEVSLENYANRDPKYYSIPGVALYLFEEKVVEGRNDGFAYFAGLADVAPTVEPKDAFDIIHKAGGKAFFSHPFAPLISLKNITTDKNEQEQIILEFKEQGLDGLECYGTGHAAEDRDFALALVEKHGLLLSAGSDWHGCLDKTGPGLKNYLPFYLDKLGDLDVPPERIEQILKGLNVTL